MNEKWILGIRVTNREHDSTRVQHILTKFGCSIKTRLGINEDEGSGSSAQGLILLELSGDPSEFVKLMDELKKIDGIEVEKMVFAKSV